MDDSATTDNTIEASGREVATGTGGFGAISVSDPGRPVNPDGVVEAVVVETGSVATETAATETAATETAATETAATETAATGQPPEPAQQSAQQSAEPRRKKQKKYICRAKGCRYQSNQQQFYGRCPKCRGFYDRIPNPKYAESAKSIADMPQQALRRLLTGCPELDRLLGDPNTGELGAVRGTTIFLYGGSGAGKTTLLVKALAQFCAQTGRKGIYASSEQPDAAIQYVARRVGVADNKLFVPRGAEPDVEKIVNEALSMKAIVVIIDSVSMSFYNEAKGRIGSAEQIKAIAGYCSSYAQGHDVIVILVGHRTKDGSYGGPEFLKHAVDAFVSLDPMFPLDGPFPEAVKCLRQLAITKNRYGPEGRTEMLEMAADGSGMRTPSAESRAALAELQLEMLGADGAIDDTDATVDDDDDVRPVNEIGARRILRASTDEPPRRGPPRRRQR